MNDKYFDEEFVLQRMNEGLANPKRIIPTKEYFKQILKYHKENNSFKK